MHDPDGRRGIWFAEHEDRLVVRGGREGDDAWAEIPRSSLPEREFAELLDALSWGAWMQESYGPNASVVPFASERITRDQERSTNGLAYHRQSAGSEKVTAVSHDVWIPGDIIPQGERVIAYDVPKREDRVVFADEPGVVLSLASPQAEWPEGKRGFILAPKLPEWPSWCTAHWLVQFQNGITATGFGDKPKPDKKLGRWVWCKNQEAAIGMVTLEFDYRIPWTERIIVKP